MVCLCTGTGLYFFFFPSLFFHFSFVSNDKLLKLLIKKKSSKGLKKQPISYKSPPPHPAVPESPPRSDPTGAALTLLDLTFHKTVGDPLAFPLQSRRQAERAQDAAWDLQRLRLSTLAEQEESRRAALDRQKRLEVERCNKQLAREQQAA